MRVTIALVSSAVEISTPPPAAPPPAIGELLEQIDIDELARTSRARPSMKLWLLLPPLGLAGLIGSIILLALARGDSLFLPLLALVLLGASAGAMFLLSRMGRSVRQERRALLGLEEQITLRHTAPALVELLRRLNRPLQMPRHRVMAFEQLSRALYTLGRYDESADAAGVVLQSPLVDPVTAFSVGCNRAMALLRADRLFDAGDAVTRLRRDAGRIEAILSRTSSDGDEAVGNPDHAAGQAQEPEAALSSELADDTWNNPTPPGGAPHFNAARLTLVEMYRDLQTRHNAEVIAAFEANRDELLSGLGIRIGDAYALAAAAFLRLDRAAEARQAWADAVCLVDPAELQRRYPELGEVARFAAHTEASS